MLTNINWNTFDNRTPDPATNTKKAQTADKQGGNPHNVALYPTSKLFARKRNEIQTLQ